MCVRITVNGQRADTTIRKSILPDQWDAIRGQASPRTTLGKAINLYIDTVRARIIRIHRDLEMDEQPFTAQQVLDLYLGRKTTNRHTLFELFREHNDKCHQLVGIDLAAATAERYETCMKLTQEFMRHTYHRDDLYLDEVDRRFVEEFEFYLKTHRGCCHNTATKYLKNFKKITRIALERLITDGRIHPARIEEMVEKAKREVDATIKAEGERAIFETNVHGLHPELVKLLGRMRYRTSYGQNVLNHSIEVSHIAGLLAAEIGANVAEAKRAGLLHDLGKSIDHEVEGSHVSIGVELARKYRESENVIHAIHAHHNDVEPQTVVACLVQAADAISAARPGARRENLENYIKRLEMLEEITSSFPGVEKSFAIQAGREVRIMVKPDQVSEDQMVLLARDIAKKIEDELEYPGQIKVNLLRETKAIEYAK